MGLNFKGNTAMGLVTHNVKKHCLRSSGHKGSHCLTSFMITPFQASEMRSACEESCFTDSDCGSSGERCCPNDCGGHTCHSPIKWTSPKQKNIKTQCVKADAFMQCLYDQLKEKVN